MELCFVPLEILQGLYVLIHTETHTNTNTDTYTETHRHTRTHISSRAHIHAYMTHACRRNTSTSLQVGGGLESITDCTKSIANTHTCMRTHSQVANKETLKLHGISEQTAETLAKIDALLGNET